MKAVRNFQSALGGETIGMNDSDMSEANFQENQGRKAVSRLMEKDPMLEHPHRNVYSLKCSYYKKGFSTIGELVEDIIESGMDPNYTITLNGKSIGEKAIDHIQG